jgi:DNA-binding IclR family transcriptional regulator
MPTSNQKKIVKTLIEEHPMDLSIGEIAHETGLTRDTVRKYLDRLQEENIIKKNRDIGRAKLYTIGPALKAMVENPETTEGEIHGLLQ